MSLDFKIDKYANNYRSVMKLLWKNAKLESWDLGFNSVFATNYLYR